MLATLTLNCNNQSLEWEQDPTEIYAGNINIDSISFKFCELWDGYTKTAVFYRNGQEAYHVLLNDDNTCLIPPEITETNGLVHIGVFGIKDDCRRTTAVKNWYLNEGILTEGKPSDPTPDIYQQIINLCNETQDKVEDVVKGEEARVEAEKTREKEFEEMKNKLPSKDNPLPITDGGTEATTPFAATRKLGQTIYNCSKSASSDISLTINTFFVGAGCELRLFVKNGSTKANLNLEVNGKNYPVYSALTGKPLTGNEIGVNQLRTFVLSEAYGDLPMRWTLLGSNVDIGMFNDLKNQIGDINTALDNIIAIQKSLIGGDSV